MRNEATAVYVYETPQEGLPRAEKRWSIASIVLPVAALVLALAYLVFRLVASLST